MTDNWISLLAKSATEIWVTGEGSRREQLTSPPALATGLSFCPALVMSTESFGPLCELSKLSALQTRILPSARPPAISPFCSTNTPFAAATRRQRFLSEGTLADQSSSNFVELLPRPIGLQNSQPPKSLCMLI